jgi:hypothetical protein
MFIGVYAVVSFTSESIQIYRLQYEKGVRKMFKEEKSKKYEIMF